MPQVPKLIDKLPIYQPGPTTDSLASRIRNPGTPIAQLGNNENSLGAPKSVIDFFKRHDFQTHRYPDGGAVTLRKKIALRNGLELPWTIVGNGSAEIIEMAARAFLDTNNTAMSCIHGFAIYGIATMASNHVVQRIPAAPGYRHNLAEFLKQISPQTKIIYLANPNNPTGTTIDSESLDNFINHVPDDILVVIDEAYREYIDRRDYPDALSYLTRNGRKNILILRTFSKIYGLASLRIGYGLAHPEIIQGLEKVRSPFNTNTLAQEAACIAMDDELHVEASRKAVMEGKILLKSGLEKIDLQVYGDDGNFVMVDSAANAAEVAQELTQWGVLVRSLEGYGLPQMLRISIGQPWEIHKCLTSLAEIKGMQNAL